MGSIEFTLFKKILKGGGYFTTKPRMRLFGLLQDSPALSMREVIEKSQKHDRVTAYRNVELFEKLGIITSMRIGNQTKLELSDKFQHHHHHMTCTHCGKVIVLKENAVIEREITRIGHGTGFKISDHQLEIRGLCSNCGK